MAVYIAVWDIFRVKEWSDLENRVRFCSLPTLNTVPLKQLSLTFTIISSML